MGRFILKPLINSLLVLTLFILPLYILANENIEYLKKTIIKLSTMSRSINDLEKLNEAGEFIKNELESFNLKVEKHEYSIGTGKTFNLYTEIGDKSKPLLIIGAHYDACGSTPGADDNASGVAALMLISKILSSAKLNCRLQLAFYSTEEPPFFRTDKMGSAKHVEKLKSENKEILGMICLEMLGYYSDEKGSQKYPNEAMKMIYPDKGNFIALIGNNDSSLFLKSIDDVFKKEKNIESISLVAPTFLKGVDFSDHLNFWQAKYKAIMITDTAFYRNTNYHTPNDTHDKINYLNIEKISINLSKYILSLNTD